MSAETPDVENPGVETPKMREKNLKAAHRVEHEADVLHLVMKPKIWKEDFLKGSEQDAHRKAAWSEVCRRQCCLLPA